VAYRRCLKKGQISRIPPSKEKAEESIKTAKHWLDEAKKNLESGALNSCIISAYLAMFHSARSVLFQDGFRERSHFCVARYLEEVYTNQNKLDRGWIDLLDHYREIRHDDQYSFSFTTSDAEAKEAIDDADRFIQRIVSLLKEGSQDE